MCHRTCGLGSRSQPLLFSKAESWQVSWIQSQCNLHSFRLKQRKYLSCSELDFRHHALCWSTLRSNLGPAWRHKTTHTHTHTPRTLSLGVTLQLFSDKYLAQLWVISLPHQVLSLLKQLDSETEGHQWVVVSGPFLNFCPFGKERWFLLVSVRAISGQLWRQEKTEMEMVRGGIRQIARYLLTAT